MNSQRLDKIISSQLNIPRSMSRTQIHRGKVTVNGEVCRDPSFAVDADTAKITYKGQAVSYKRFVYLVMNKPKGVLSASTDKNRETVIDLVPQSLKRANLSPVGRLDKDTTGLLLITDDGEFAHKVISPKSEILKTYEVTLDDEISNEVADKFAQGIVLADGTKCKPAIFEILAPNKARVKISEGKYHQIKRMFGTVDLGVNELTRLSIGAFTLPDTLKAGECRELTKEELDLIFISC